jgi:hypothetical protein
MAGTVVHKLESNLESALIALVAFTYPQAESVQGCVRFAQRQTIEQGSKASEIIEAKICKPNTAVTTSVNPKCGRLVGWSDGRSCGAARANGRVTLT